MKLDVLAFGAHPDDVELGCGGTIAKLIANGKKVGIIDLTLGELGTRGTPEIRQLEANNAAKILDVSVRENLSLRDGFFMNDEESQIKVIEKIRKHQPDIVICNAVKDRHIDHGKGADLVSDASFLSGLRKIYTGQKEWRPKYVFHYIQWEDLKPDFVIDISGFLDTKIKAVLAYQSQFHNPNSTEPETAITSLNFQESVRYRAMNWGRLAWKDAGEGFQCKQTLVIDDLFNFI